MWPSLHYHTLEKLWFFFSLLFKARHPRKICTPLRASPQGKFSPLLSYHPQSLSRGINTVSSPEKSVRTFSSDSWDVCQAFDIVLKFCPHLCFYPLALVRFLSCQVLPPNHWCPPKWRTEGRTATGHCWEGPTVSRSWNAQMPQSRLPQLWDPPVS